MATFRDAARGFAILATSVVGMTWPGSGSNAANDEATRSYINCVRANAKTGNYSSLDGGQSAMRLMAQCLDEWRAYQDACHQRGSADFQCNAASIGIAQTALKQFGK